MCHVSWCSENTCDVDGHPVRVEPPPSRRPRVCAGSAPISRGVPAGPRARKRPGVGSNVPVPLPRFTTDPRLQNTPPPLLGGEGAQLQNPESEGATLDTSQMRKLGFRGARCLRPPRSWEAPAFKFNPPGSEDKPFSLRGVLSLLKVVSRHILRKVNDGVTR